MRVSLTYVLVKSVDVTGKETWMWKVSLILNFKTTFHIFKTTNKSVDKTTLIKITVVNWRKFYGAR